MEKGAEDIARPIRARKCAGALAAGISMLGTIGVISIGYLRATSPVGVDEPIAMIDGCYYDDGGSRSITFRDAAGVTRYACLLNEMDGRQNLIFGGRELPVRGVDEKAFLELLERWANSQRESKPGEADRQTSLILEDLRQRNGRDSPQPTQ